MQIDEPCKELSMCVCGYRPDHYTIGYGRTPYGVYCHKCGKQSDSFSNGVGGHQGNIILFWNHIAPFWRNEIFDTRDTYNQLMDPYWEENQNKHKDWQRVIEALKSRSDFQERYQMALVPPKRKKKPVPPPEMDSEKDRCTGCHLVFSVGRQEWMFVNMAGDRCQTCRGTGQVPKGDK